MNRNIRVDYFLILILFFIVSFFLFANNSLFKGTAANDNIRYKINFSVNDDDGILDGNNELYVINGGSNIYANDSDNTLGNIPSASKDSYVFTGWWTSSTGGELIIYPSGDVVESTVDGYIKGKKWQLLDDTILYAQYIENGHKVTYNCQENGGNTNNVYMIYADSELADLSRICKKNDLNTPFVAYADWTFVGWNTNKDATYGFDSYIVGDSDTELYAIYRKEKVILKAFWSIDGSNLESTLPTTCTIFEVYNKELQADSCVVTPPIVTPNDGYMFIGWDTDKDSQSSNEYYNIYNNELTLTKNINVGMSEFSPDDDSNAFVWYAVFDTKKYKLTLNTNNGIIEGKNEFYIKNGETFIYYDIYSNKMGTIPIVSRAGYTFDGWYTEDELRVIDRFGNLVNTTITGYVLNGKWDVADDIVLFAHYNLSDEINGNDIFLDFSSLNDFIVDNDKKLIYQIVPGMSLSQLSDMTLTDVELTLLDNQNNEVLDNDLLKTGYKIRAVINDNEIYYKLSVKGDPLGTGELSRNNAKEIAKYIIYNNNNFVFNIDDEYLYAFDYDNDGKIKMNDVIKILRDIEKS